MDPLQNPVVAAQTLLDKYKGELARLEVTKKGLEAKITHTRAKIEAAGELLESMKNAAAEARRPPS